MFRKFLSLIAVLSSTALLFSNSALADISIMEENASPCWLGKWSMLKLLHPGMKKITGFQLPKDYAEAGFGSTGLSFIGFTAGPDFASTTSTAAPSSIFNFDRSFSDLQIGGGANLNLGDSLLYTMHLYGLTPALSVMISRFHPVKSNDRRRSADGFGIASPVSRRCELAT